MLTRCLISLVIGVSSLLLGAAESLEAPLAWVRFDGLPQRYLEVPYLYLGEVDLQVTLDVKPESGHILEIRWGAKQDERTALLMVNGREFPLRSGGYDGFRWLAVAMPESVQGERYELAFRAALDGKPAFLAEIRLCAENGERIVDVSGTTSRASFKTSTAKKATAYGQVFPEMRAIWDRVPIAKNQIQTPAEECLRKAERNARQAAEALYRCRRFVDGWLAHADPETGLIPRNLRESKDYWNGRDAAADNYPFMVLTAAFTDHALFEGRMLEMLRTETRLTCRVDRLPDDYSFSRKGWRRERLDLDAIIFDGAEYVKDGLIPLTEWLGPSPWSERALGIIDDIWKHAPIETPFGRIPTHNFEVNGDLLQACSRLYWFTGERKYIDWAIRLGDYYLLGDHHPTRDLPELKLGDHSCEVINGLSELYVTTKYTAPEKKMAYEKPLHELYDRILEIGRDEHGLIYLNVDNRTGRPKGSALTDNWGYNYDGIYTAWLVDGTEAYRDAVRKVLSNLKAFHTGKGGMCQSNTADGYADSIEGAITLMNREPDTSAEDWIDSEIKTMWGKQKPEGIIEGWHGDGNSARTSIMYALWKSLGTQIQPWRPDVRLGAAREGDDLYLSLSADEAWAGRILFDRPRHREIFKLPMDYPRINQFPEWFTVEAEQQYTVHDLTTDSVAKKTGKELREGLVVELKAGQELRLRLKR